jgi:hypothetical protein
VSAAAGALEEAVGSGESPVDGVVSLLPDDREQAATKKSIPKANRRVFQPILLFLNILG